MDPSQKRYYTWNQHLKDHFGDKVFKVSLDGGFTCPNRDGTVAYGGCTFCSASGSGEFAQSRIDPLVLQMEKGIEMMHLKWPHVNKYIAYFQNFTNTHAPVATLKHRYEQVTHLPGVVGLMIATRPDCLPSETIEYLAELNQRMYLWVELGLQTVHDQTSIKINRAHDYQTYLDAVARLRQHNIRVCTHLINGLPGETPEMMVENVRRTILDSDIQGLKLHLLYLLHKTKMMKDYERGDLRLLDQDEYIQIVCDQLEIIPPEIIIHRITGDPPREGLVGPQWAVKKWEVLNAIDQALIARDTYQGKKNCRNNLSFNERITL